MSATLTLTDVDLVAGPRTLATAVSLTLAPGDVTALVGPNGAGKSTLMRTLVGELPLERGRIALAPRDATVGYLPQQLPLAGESLRAYVGRRTGVDDAERALTRAADALAGDSPDADEYDACLQHWLALGGADLDDRLPEVLARIGLVVDPLRPLGSLSGGQAARVSLASVLLSRHDILLLDEPTNDLDSRGLAALRDLVTGYAGPVLIASHDRAFLDDVATAVLELDLHQRRVEHYTGGWSEYRAERDLRRRQAWERYAGYAEQRDALEAQARQRDEWASKGARHHARSDEPDKHLRFRIKARAERQAGRAGALRQAADRLEAVDQPRKEWELRYEIAAAAPSSEIVATLDRAVVRRGGFTLGPVTCAVERGERIAVTGDNGSGKTTLVGALLGDIPLDEGRRSTGTRLATGVIDQRRSVIAGPETVVEVVARHLGESDRAEVRTLLAKFGLGADHVDRPCDSLSMGERTRAALAVLQGRAVNLVVLDEPTNHLDVAAIEQLQSALAAWTGTLLLVSHDRALLAGVAMTQTWRMEAGRLTVVRD